MTAAPEPALESIAGFFGQRFEEGFEREEDPFGRPWQALDARTFERKLGPLILTESRRLRDFPQPEFVDEFTIVIGPDADIPYARIHAAGGVAGRGAQIPQRQYVGAEEGDAEVSAALRSSTKGRRAALVKAGWRPFVDDRNAGVDALLARRLRRWRVTAVGLIPSVPMGGPEAIIDVKSHRLNKEGTEVRNENIHSFQKMRRSFAKSALDLGGEGVLREYLPGVASDLLMLSRKVRSLAGRA